jgi:hypothetical protein
MGVLALWKYPVVVKTGRGRQPLPSKRTQINATETALPRLDLEQDAPS